MIEKLKTKE